MRKIITCMILGLLSLVSCTEYDEVAMWNKTKIWGRGWQRWRNCAAG